MVAPAHFALVTSRFQSVEKGVRQSFQRLAIFTMWVAESTRSAKGGAFANGESGQLMNLAGRAIQAARTKALALEVPTVPVAPHQDHSCTVEDHLQESALIGQ